MVEEIKLNAAKRFGSRYGRTVRQKFVEVEQLHRNYYKCRFCTKTAVKRVAAGIWECRACKKQFTGKAYTPSIIRFAQITGKEALEEDLLAPREKEEDYTAEEQQQEEVKETKEEKKRRKKAEQAEEQEQYEQEDQEDGKDGQYNQEDEYDQEDEQAPLHQENEDAAQGDEEEHQNV